MSWRLKLWSGRQETDRCSIVMSLSWNILASMKNSLLQQNPRLHNAKSYREALRHNVVSEGVKKAAGKALPAPGSLSDFARNALILLLRSLFKQMYMLLIINVSCCTKTRSQTVFIGWARFCAHADTKLRGQKSVAHPCTRLDGDCHAVSLSIGIGFMGFR